MTSRDAFEIWAPPAAQWSQWAKPVLFAHLGDAHAVAAAEAPVPPAFPPTYQAAWAAPADGRTVLVIDLPGRASVWLAEKLAAKGYRPVPLFNAIPFGRGSGLLSGDAVCDLWPVVAAIAAATPAIAAARLPAVAPPAFLLDADRRTGTGRSPAPGMYDNRSVSLPTDFPSANLLLSRGVTSALLVQARDLEPQPDLAHTLLRWQQAGIEIRAVMVAGDAASAPVAITVSRPRWYRMAWQRLLATAGLRRSPLGGFGGLLPLASAGG